MGAFLKLKEVTRDTLNEFCSNKMYDMMQKKKIKVIFHYGNMNTLK